MFLVLCLSARASFRLRYRQISIVVCFLLVFSLLSKCDNYCFQSIQKISFFPYRTLFCIHPTGYFVLCPTLGHFCLRKSSVFLLYPLQISSKKRYLVNYFPFPLLMQIILTIRLLVSKYTLYTCLSLNASEGKNDGTQSCRPYFDTGLKLFGFLS